jgi:hypothetical protein
MKSISRAFQRAGPRKLLHFEPSTVNAAIVTCGGLCPVSRDIDVPRRCKQGRGEQGGGGGGL